MKQNELREMVRLIGRADLVYHLEQAEAAVDEARKRATACRHAVEQVANEHAFARWLQEHPAVAALPVLSHTTPQQADIVEVRLLRPAKGRTRARVMHIAARNGEVGSREVAVPASGTETSLPPVYWFFGRVSVAPELLTGVV